MPFVWDAILAGYGPTAEDPSYPVSFTAYYERDGKRK